MKALLLSIVLLVSGCAGAHLEDRVKNAADAAKYGIALQDCLDEAAKALAVDEPIEQIQREYDACAKAADDKYGRKP